MRSNFVARRIILMAIASPLLAGCFERAESAAPSTLTQDDDTFCRAAGTIAPGSPQYIACRKDRDAQRDAANARADRRQRDLGEYMMNHPDHP